MNSNDRLRNRLRGWFPQDPVPSLSGHRKIEAVTINRKAIDKKLLTGTVTVSLIILIFGAFIYYSFGQPMVYGPRGWYTTSHLIDESLAPYINITSHGGARAGSIENGWLLVNDTVNWKGSPQDPVKELKNIHIVMYTKVDNTTYVNGTLTYITIGSYIEAFPNEPILPNNIIDHTELVIPKIGLDTPKYPCTLNCSTSVNISQLGDA